VRSRQSPWNLVTLTAVVSTGRMPINLQAWRDRGVRGGPPDARTSQCGDDMLETVLLIVLILLLIGALPAWPHSRSWGYYPSGGLGLVLLIIIILLLLGRV
jgi:hypothetical protein